MRIISPMGKLYRVKAVVPVVEKYDKFNGATRKLSEVARGFSVNPNAIAVQYESTPCSPFGGMPAPAESELLIGNFTTEKVKEICDTILKNGYYDFSTMMYQKLQNFDDLVLDDGASLPYTSESLPYAFWGKYFSPQCNFEFPGDQFMTKTVNLEDGFVNEDEDEEEGDEE